MRTSTTNVGRPTYENLKPGTVPGFDSLSRQREVEGAESYLLPGTHQNCAPVVGVLPEHQVLPLPGLRRCCAGCRRKRNLARSAMLML
jgi:hypothetical protein